MNVLDINGLHLEVVPFKKNNKELYRMCFNSEASIIVSNYTIDEIDGQIFINALDGPHETTITNNDDDKTDFILVAYSDYDLIVISLSILCKDNTLKYNDYVYTINKSDKKKINKFRKGLVQII